MVFFLFWGDVLEEKVDAEFDVHDPIVDTSPQQFAHIRLHNRLIPNNALENIKTSQLKRLLRAPLRRETSFGIFARSGGVSVRRVRSCAYLDRSVVVHVCFFWVYGH